MIRLSDAAVLAYTKLRVHKVRTGVSIAVAGLLFGLIAAVIIVVQGIFTSVDSFSDEGLNNRTVLSVTENTESKPFSAYDYQDDANFIAEVEAAHKALVAKKTAAAKKYGVSYSAEAEDPSPIALDTETKQRYVKEDALRSALVQSIAEQKRKTKDTQFDINTFAAQYTDAKVIQKYYTVQPVDGSFEYMQEGKEAFATKQPAQMGGSGNEAASLSVLDASLSAPFVSSATFDPSKGEIPAIIPYGKAEKLLGLKPLDTNASMQDEYKRLQEVRTRISEVAVSYCYRNAASQTLLAQALAQEEEMRQNAKEPHYVKPALIYTVPSEDSCGPVLVASDTRTAAQKRYDEQLILYQKEVGEYGGEPAQQRIIVRGVGVSSEGDSASSSIADFINSLLGSSLGYGTWSIPADLLAKVPAEYRPDALFAVQSEKPNDLFSGISTYLVEFSDKDEARKLITGQDGRSSQVYASPFGSGVLFVDELRHWFTIVLLWAFAIVGLVALIILAGIIGRTVSEGRRESSIFRAIGASRLDISMVYGMYVLFLALRVVLFAAALGIAIALTIELLFWQDATLGARLAYAASDVAKEFHLFSLASPYLLWMIGVVIVASILASIAPILLGARRNPIKDMRNDT